jgi:arogenate/prephenate dehydratase
MGLNVEREAFDDTTGAVEHIIAAGLRDTADIASARVADPYSLLSSSARRTSSASDGRHR